jgi:quinol monooxygenase YgiN
MVVLHLRLHQVAARPPLLDKCVRYIRRELRPAVEGEPGSLGLSLYVSPGLGVAVLESFWASAEALRASESAAESIRSELARRARGSVTGEQYRILVFERGVPPHGGEAVRLTRMQAKPSAVEEVAEVFGESAVPWLAETPGFRAALLFADPDSGYLISQSVWRDPQARAASPSTATVIQADVMNATDCVIRAIEDYSLVFNSARKP